MSKKLFRSRKNKMIFGLAGGLGEYLEVDPTIIRILFVIFSFFFGTSLLLYLIISIIVPLEEY